jgi:hypothetical protein
VTPQPDPLRDAAGQFRSPTPAERLGFAITAPPEPGPEAPPRRGPLIPAGPMGDGTPHSGDPIRAALKRLNRH